MTKKIEIECSLRLLSLTKEEASEIAQSNPEVGISPHFKSGNDVAYAPLSLTTISLFQTYISKYRIGARDHDIFVSLTSDRDTGIVDVPSIVNEAILKLGSRVVLSYTVF